jgi:hypothetical protein
VTQSEDIVTGRCHSTDADLLSAVTNARYNINPWGSNTATVTLRIVGGDEKGSLKSETVKYGRESHGTRAQERLRWQGPAAYIKDRPVLSSDFDLDLCR